MQLRPTRPPPLTTASWRDFGLSLVWAVEKDVDKRIDVEAVHLAIEVQITKQRLPAINALELDKKSRFWHRWL